MFDTRPLEKVTSILVWFAFAVMPLTFVAVFALFGLLALTADGGEGTGTVLVGGSCCGMVLAPLVSLVLVRFFRWVNTGMAGPFLDDVAQRLGGGQVSTAGWLWCMTKPVLAGQAHQRPYVFSLRRQAGVLSPSRVGGTLGPFGWLFSVKVPVQLPMTVGFGPSGKTTGSSLLGLRHPVELGHGLVGFTGGTPEGEALVRRPDLVAAAQRIITFGARGGLLLKMGPGGVAATGFARPDISPEMTAAFLDDVTRLASAVASASPPGG